MVSYFPPSLFLFLSASFNSIDLLAAVHSSQIIGPSLFGITYATTVSTFPKAMFFLAVAMITSSMLALTLVRFPDSVKLDEEREPLICSGAVAGAEDESESTQYTSMVGMESGRLVQRLGHTFRTIVYVLRICCIRIETYGFLC